MGDDIVKRLRDEIERLQAELLLERSVSYERCRECDTPDKCSREIGCLVVQVLRNLCTLTRQTESVE